jgi:hypothetical protein
MTFAVTPAASHPSRQRRSCLIYSVGQKNMDIIDYQKALDANQSNERHILLGNGFSISCRSNIFSYKRLWEEAEKNGSLKSTLNVFKSLNTADFERVIRSLRDTSKTLSAYPGAPSELVKKLQADADSLRETLVATIAKNHPDYPGVISDEEYKNCRNFLGNFKSFFTTSYDLLLYWAIMHEPGPDSLNKRNDGFKKPKSGSDSDYVSWEPSRAWFQNVFYLHGALHIYDSDTEIQKYTWNNTEIKLIDQIRSALSRDLFPIFVSEGSSDEKYTKIRHSDFLTKGHTELCMLKGVLFTFGHSLASSDAHIVRAIARSKVSKVYVGMFGDPQSEENQAMIQNALAIPAMRDDDRYPVDIYFCDSSKVVVWK